MGSTGMNKIMRPRSILAMLCATAFLATTSHAMDLDNDPGYLAFMETVKAIQRRVERPSERPPSPASSIKSDVEPSTRKKSKKLLRMPQPHFSTCPTCPSKGDFEHNAIFGSAQMKRAVISTIRVAMFVTLTLKDQVTN